MCETEQALTLNTLVRTVLVQLSHRQHYPAMCLWMELRINVHPVLQEVTVREYGTSSVGFLPPQKLECAVNLGYAYFNDVH